MGGAGGNGGNRNGNVANGGNNNSGSRSGNGGIAFGNNGNGGNGGGAVGGNLLATSTRQFWVWLLLTVVWAVASSTQALHPHCCCIAIMRILLHC